MKRQKNSRHHDGRHDGTPVGGTPVGAPIFKLIIFLRETLGVAWVHIVLKDGILLEMDPPPYLSSVLTVHAEARVADDNSPDVLPRYVGFRKGEQIARALTKLNPDQQTRTPDYVRECRQDLRELFEETVLRAGHKFFAPPLFEFKPHFGTRIAAEVVEIRRIPDPPAAQVRGPLGSNGNVGDNGPSSMQVN